MVHLYFVITDGAERLRRRREDRKSGSLQEAVRSSSLMGGLYQRTDSKMLGSASPAPVKGRGPPCCLLLSLPIAFSFIGGRDILKSPPLDHAQGRGGNQYN